MTATAASAKFRRSSRWDAKNGRRIGPASIIATVLVSILEPTARADTVGTWSIHPPAQDTVTIGEPIQLTLPTGLSSAQLASLAVELDHVDITGLARITDGAVLYNPAQPLEPGSHDLRVIEYSASGRLIARGSWQFTATPKGGARASKRGFAVKGSVRATASERIADSNLTQPAPGRFTLNGTFDVKATRQMAEWSADATIKGLYGTDNGTAAVGGQAVQPGQMQVALRHGKSNLILGDQTLPFDDLAISGLTRRGISAHLADLPLASELTAFGVRDSAQIGFQGGFGVGDPDDHVAGGILQTHLIPALSKLLTLQAGWVTGTSPGGFSLAGPYPGGNSTYPPPGLLAPTTTVQPGSGNAWFVAANSEIAPVGLTLKAQYARSTFDSPATVGEDNTRTSDRAYSFGGKFTHLFGQAWTFGLDANYQSVGSFFTSLANPTLAPDQRMLTATAMMSGHGLTLTAGDGYTEDNVDDNAALATVRSVPRQASLTYSPVLPKPLSWLGTPSLSVSRQDVRTHDETSPAGALPTDSDVVNGTATLNFAYTRLSWQLGVTNGEFRDYTGQQDDTHSIGPTLGLTLRLGGSAFAAVNAQALDTRDETRGTTTRDLNYSLNGGDNFWHDRFGVQLGVSVNHNTQQIIPGTIPPQLIGNEVVLKTGTVQLLWHALQATPRRGGLDVGLSSSWNESTGLNTSALTTQGYGALATQGLQCFLTVSSTWPLQWGDP